MPDISAILRREVRPPQAEAVLDDRREVLCIACAASGELRTLAYRVISGPFVLGSREMIARRACKPSKLLKFVKDACE